MAFKMWVRGVVALSKSMHDSSPYQTTSRVQKEYVIDKSNFLLQINIWCDMETRCSWTNERIVVCIFDSQPVTVEACVCRRSEFGV